MHFIPILSMPKLYDKGIYRELVETELSLLIIDALLPSHLAADFLPLLRGQGLWFLYFWCRIHALEFLKLANIKVACPTNVIHASNTKLNSLMLKSSHHRIIGILDHFRKTKWYFGIFSKPFLCCFLLVNSLQLLSFS